MLYFNMYLFSFNASEMDSRSMDISGLLTAIYFCRSTNITEIFIS